MSIRGEVDDLHYMWSAMNQIFKDQEELIHPWKGVLKQCYISCFHCLLKGIEPHRWMAKDIFSQRAQWSAGKVVCPKDNSVLPLGLTHPFSSDGE